MNAHAAQRYFDLFSAYTEYFLIDFSCKVNGNQVKKVNLTKVEKKKKKKKEKERKIKTRGRPCIRVKKKTKTGN